MNRERNAQILYSSSNFTCASKHWTLSRCRPIEMHARRARVRGERLLDRVAAPSWPDLDSSDQPASRCPDHSHQRVVWHSKPSLLTPPPPPHTHTQIASDQSFPIALVLSVFNSSVLQNLPYPGDVCKGRAHNNAIRRGYAWSCQLSCISMTLR